MSKSKSWAPSLGGATCAGAEDATGCCCDADTPGAGDSCAVNDNKLSCRVASMQIGRAKYTLPKRTLMWEELTALYQIPSSRVRLLQPSLPPTFCLHYPRMIVQNGMSQV